MTAAYTIDQRKLTLWKSNEADIVKVTRALLSKYSKYQNHEMLINFINDLSNKAQFLYLSKIIDLPDDITDKELAWIQNQCIKETKLTHESCVEYSKYLDNIEGYLTTAKRRGQVSDSNKRCSKKNKS